jgi:hypothetical protein
MSSGAYEETFDLGPDLSKADKVEVTIEAIPAPGMTLDELEAEMRRVGNRVVGRDDARNVLILVQGEING